MSHVVYKCLGVFFFSLFFCISVSGATIVKSPNNNGLVGYWSFNEGTSTQASDFSTNKNTGTLVNGPTWVNGKNGKALSFDGVDSHIPLAFGVPLSSVSISVWFKTSSTGNTNAFIGHQGGFQPPGVGLSFVPPLWILSDGRVRGELWNGVIDPIYSVAGYNDDKWHNVVLVGNVSTQSMYLDGVFVGSKSGPVSLSWWDNTTIGAGFVSGREGQSGWGYFSGSLDEVRMYNRALSSPEISVLYNSGFQKINSSQNTKVTSGLVGLWTFDGADLSGTLAYDRAGSNNGTLTNGPTRSLGRISQALSFDGVDDYLPLGNASGLQLTTGTISAWIKTSDAGSSFRGIFVKQFAYGLFLENNILTVYDWGSGFGISTHTNLANNQWHHVVITFNSGVSNGTFIYIDGVLTLTITITVSNQLNGLSIGCGGLSVGNGNTCDNQFFKGIIDEARIYNRALTQAEINQLYAMGEGTKVNTSQNKVPGSSLESGLVGMWSFNGVDLTDKIYDRSTQANNGYFIGGATSSAKTIGKVGQAIKFDGVDDRVDVSHSSSLNISGQITMSAWVNVSSFPSSGTGCLSNSCGTIVEKGYDGTNEPYFLRFQNEGGIIRIYSGSFQVPTNYDVAWNVAGINANEWHHIVGQYDGTNWKIYVDGVEKASTPQASGALVNTKPLNVGTSDINGVLSRFLNGKIDEVRIYNRALTATEVKQLYNLGK